MDPRKSITTGFLASGINVDVVSTVGVTDVHESLTALNEVIGKRNPGAIVTTRVHYNGHSVSIGNKNLVLKGVAAMMKDLCRAELKNEPKEVLGEPVFKPEFVLKPEFISNLNLKIPEEKEMREAKLICELFTTLNGVIGKRTPGAEVTINVSYANRFVSIGGNKNLTVKNVAEAMRTLSGTVLGIKPEGVFGEFISKPNLNIQEENLVAQLDHLKHSFEVIKIKLISSVAKREIDIRLTATDKDRCSANKVLARFFLKMEPLIIVVLDNFVDYLKRDGTQVVTTADGFRNDAEGNLKKIKKGVMTKLDFFEITMKKFTDILKANNVSREFVATFNNDVANFVAVNGKPFLGKAQK